ncbi:hypothetical protein [Oligoflexus tunisiensis]|uniref:hypothetical protein n=1 Tax=Oligoflexus tunisiensis TaxID=708132 RepID=UPI00114D02E2|nr:hypothetical protein [Oligoflexus tunisiensis]
MKCRNSYLVKVLPCAVALTLMACGKAESEEDQEDSLSESPTIRYEPEYENYYYSGCVAAHANASYQAEMRRIIFKTERIYEAETVAFDSIDCKTNLAAVIQSAGYYTHIELTKEHAFPGFRMNYGRDSLSVRAIHARELDAWNGILTAQPVCDQFQSELGNNIEINDMKCLDANGEYTIAPGSEWVEIVHTTEDQTSLSLSGMVFGHLPDLQAHHAGLDMSAAVPMKTLDYFEEGEIHYIGSYSYSSIANNAFGLSLQLAGSWQACHEGNLVTLNFSGNTYSQTGKVGMGEDCSGSAAYTVTYSGTFSVPDGLDYVEGGYKINYFNSATKYTVHTTAALDELFNGNTANTTEFCSGFTFTLDTETTLNGKNCKSSPTSESSYATVGSMTLYDIILFRDNEIVDSLFTAEGQGSSDINRPYFFNGDLRYKKL